LNIATSHRHSEFINFDVFYRLGLSELRMSIGAGLLYLAG